MSLRLNRYRDLKARGIVTSWVQLKRMIEFYGFPPGKMLTPNCRTWTDQEIDAYYASRPVTGPELRGIAKRRRASKAATQPETGA
jgi:hypothetical protein